MVGVVGFFGGGDVVASLGTDMGLLAARLLVLGVCLGGSNQLEAIGMGLELTPKMLFLLRTVHWMSPGGPNPWVPWVGFIPYVVKQAGGGSTRSLQTSYRNTFERLTRRDGIRLLEVRHMDKRDRAGKQRIHSIRLTTAGLELMEWVERWLEK